MEGNEWMSIRKSAGQPRKRSPIISNTGFLGATFVDTIEIEENAYHFPRASLQIVHHVLNGLLQASTSIFNEHGISAHLACVYLKRQKKLGLVLSKQKFTEKEGEAYFHNYLLERNLYDGIGGFRDVYNTGFLGAVFIDLSNIERFTYEFEMKLLLNLIKSFLIPAKELFISHNIKAYISGVEISSQDKIGFVLSKKPYDEKKEADLYFAEYLKERGLFKLKGLKDITLHSFEG